MHVANTLDVHPLKASPEVTHLVLEPEELNSAARSHRGGPRRPSSPPRRGADRRPPRCRRRRPIARVKPASRSTLRASSATTPLAIPPRSRRMPSLARATVRFLAIEGHQLPADQRPGGRRSSPARGFFCCSPTPKRRWVRVRWSGRTELVEAADQFQRCSRRLKRSAAHIDRAVVAGKPCRDGLARFRGGSR